MYIKASLLAALVAACMWAQGSGALTGKITDGTGAGVPNAVIIITDSSNRSQRIVTSVDGSFSVANLSPGTYRVEVESNGFRRAGARTIEITTDRPSQVEVTIDETTVSAGQSGVAEIRAVSPTLQTDSAEVSRSYGTRTIRSLPVLDRQAQELIGLMPGISPPTVSNDRILDPQRTRTFNVNGQPSFANIDHQDGSQNTEAVTRQVSRVTPNEAIEALNVRTSNYNAEYGFAGGSWSNVVTRPGTNAVHGSLFEFNSNSFFVARNPLTPAGTPSPRFNTNQFGGTLGGPVIKDRMFFFLSYDGYMRRGNEMRFATVPTPELLSGNFSQFPGLVLFNPRTGNASGMNRTPFPNNQIPVTQLNPASQALLPYFPAPNQSGFNNNLVGNAMLIDDTHRGDIKLDHRFSDRSSGFFRYGFTHGSTDRGSILGPLGDAASSELRNHNAVANFSHSVTGSLLAEFRLGYSRYRNEISPFMDMFSNAGALTDRLNTLGFTNGIPQFTINGLGTFGLGSAFPSKPINNTFNPATNWIAHTGMHRLKFGVDARIIQASGFDPGLFGSRGSFQFGPGSTASVTGTSASVNTLANSFAAFLVGAPSTAASSMLLETPTYRQQQYAGYITDTLNLWQKLYLELGVRYDLYSPVKTRRDFGTVTYDPTTGMTMPGDSLDHWDYNNIAPRVGFAIRPAERVVVRGGYGIHFFPVPFSLSVLNFASSGLQSGIGGGFTSVPFATPAVPRNPQYALNQPYYTTSNRRPDTPYIQTFSFMIQADMGEGFLFDAGYVGSLGRQLPFSRLMSAAMPGTGVAGLPFGDFDNRTANVTERGTGLNSNYNSLQLNLTKRLSKGLAFAGAYTFSKALDSGTELLNPFDTSANYAVADWDRRHILSVSHVWNLPFGAGTTRGNQGTAAYILSNWEINGILRWATGTPYSVTADPLFCACPGLSSIPANLMGSAAINGQASFDPSLFATPAAGGFGNLSRNQFRGPDFFTYNVSLFRNFPVHDRAKLEFRAEVYNVTNSSNYANPIANVSAPGFGRSFQNYNGLGGRQFQIAGRLLF
jgi:hypothetical protein